jgi:cell division protein FtsB
MSRIKGRHERMFLRAGLFAATGLLVVIGVFLAGAVWDVAQKERIARAERDVAEKKWSDLTLRRNALKADVATLSTERGVEEEIREKYPLVKEGEELIVLVDMKKSGVRNQEPESKTIWQYFKEWMPF